MSDSSFEFRRFKPRDGLQEEVDRLLTETLRDLPQGTVARAVVVDAGQSYMFSAVVKVGHSLFSSEVAVGKTTAVGRQRLWQMETSAQLLRDVVLQVKRWETSQPIPRA